MSVTICADGVFEEQALELITYLARPKAEEEREAFIASYGELKVEGEAREALVAKIVDSVQTLGDGTEREVEGFFNLLLAVVLATHDIHSTEFARIYPSILGALTGDKRRELRRAQYQILSNLHNLLPASSSLRLPTLQALLSLAVLHKDLASIGFSPANLKSWVSEWSNVSPEDKAAFVASVASEFENDDRAGQGAASYPYHLLHLSLLPASSSPPSPAITSTLLLALRLPALVDYAPLLALPSVAAAPASPASALVALFRTANLADWNAWLEAHPATLGELGLDREKLTRKIRCLTLATLCAGRSEVSYAEIAKALEVEEKEVEVWVIDVIRLGLLSAKLSQPTRSVRIQRAYIRSFEAPEWKALQARLAAWDDNLVSVSEVVSEAKRIGQGFANGNPSGTSAAAAAIAA